jgi:chromosome segregation ATPase
MKTSRVDEPTGLSPEESGFPEGNGKGWLARKRDLIERLSAGAASDLYRGDLAREMKMLSEEVDSLEEANHAFARQVRELQEALAKKREEARKAFEKSDAIKKKLVGSFARKRGLLNEISFFEKEKSQLFKTYVGISESLQSNAATLDRTLKDMGFFKGEVQVLLDKMGMLEGDVPVKYRDVDNLDEKIKRTSQTLKSFCSRMHDIERTVTEIYYVRKKV